MSGSAIQTTAEDTRAYGKLLADPLAIKELTPQMKEIAALLVLGLEDSHSPLGPQPGKPLSVEEAAEVAGVRRRYVRRLQQSPVFMAECSSLLAALRRGEHAKSIHTMVEIRDKPDAKDTDRLNAAKAILGEDAKGPSVTINNNNTNVSVGKVGYHIEPYQAKEPVVIEGKAE